ncbi:hypothetical protein FNF27_05673 [Cafeteria roenbergensis]|uniref:Uncharacterized protein n=1 Tax=Cafeteria roenbergensis TaxID=33653 RepID=A0A5A8E4V6_CAFRO|nr:hypothetical protein FNF27_05673 [Cafeteria roenbergensis]
MAQTEAPQVEMRTLVGDAQAALGHVRDAVAAYTSSLSEELQAGGSLARKLATDAQASHDELNALADSMAASDEVDTLRRADLVYPALARAMLLLSSAATAAADFDDTYKLQERASAAVTDAYTRAAGALASAQEGAKALQERAAPVAGAAEAIRGALASAEARVAALIEASPEGSLVDTVRSGLEGAQAELADIRSAWDAGRKDGLLDAASGALGRAHSALMSAATASKTGMRTAIDSTYSATRIRAFAAVEAARTQVDSARTRFTPALAEAAALGAEGAGSLTRAVAVLGRAAEDVVVEAAVAGNNATGCSARVAAAVEALHLRSAVDAVVDKASALAESEGGRAVVQRATEVDSAYCGGCGSRSASAIWRLAEALVGYAGHIATRVSDATVTKAAAPAPVSAAGTPAKPSCPPASASGADRSPATSPLSRRDEAATFAEALRRGDGSPPSTFAEAAIHPPAEAPATQHVTVTDTQAAPSGPVDADDDDSADDAGSSPRDTSPPRSHTATARSTSGTSGRRRRKPKRSGQ